MNAVDKGELKLLAETRAGHAVSIYMPTHRAEPDLQQDPIRLKNLLGEAEKRLAANGLKSSEARRLMEPADELTQPHNFWQDRREGMAVFMAPDFFRYYRLSFPVEELLVTGTRFHLKPLLPLLAPDGTFYVLALSQNQVRLLEGTRHTVQAVDLARLPKSLSEALRADVHETQLQFHTGTRAPGGSGGDRQAVYFGQGSAKEENKTDLLRYFHRVDDGVREWLGPRAAPLVLAGVDYLLPIYREANTYPHLVEAGIKGNSDELRPEELHQEAWAIVRPHFIARREAFAERFRQLAGAGDKLAARDIMDIVPAAHYSRVENLWVLLGRKQWGKFDAATGEVQLANEPNGEAEDLYDLAAVQTYLNGGNVYAVTADKMPDASPIAAILRY